MSEVLFYSGVSDRLGFVCKLLRKAVASGARVGVCGPQRALDKLDQALWVHEPHEFVPHLSVRPDSDPELLQRTPVLLVSQLEQLPHREVLLNLETEVPTAFDEFQRILEVVSTEAQTVQWGRRRYKHYQQAGCEMQHYVAGEGR
ncbi:DNA polymerase III subunit chi [Roseateles sp. BYS180W]|uniref:DNA polymerase III subunit chi n=1 Tax=Roseateles rivi TaxID=3299028 RepID=A0ABW7FXU0_9BURK